MRPLSASYEVGNSTLVLSLIHRARWIALNMTRKSLKEELGL